MRFRVFAVTVAAVLGGCTSSAVAPTAPPAYGIAARPNSFNVTPFNAPTSIFPGATSTEPTGIRERYITATVTLSNGTTLGGLCNRAKKTWSQIAYPGAQSTAAYGPRAITHGALIVGSYKNPGQKGDNGFVYDSTTGKYAPLTAPPNLCAPQSCNFTIAHSVFGGAKHYIVVGNYDAAAKAPTIAGHAFIYDSATKAFATIDLKNAASTTAYGIWIDGKTLAVAGGYADKKGRHAYVRDLTGNHFLSYDYPKAALTHFEGITGAGGPGNYNVVGDYTKPRDKAVYGFYLQIRDWKPWPPIVIGKLTANSVDVRTAIGVYNPGSGISGFITTLPVQDPP
jgi:subtilase-type serine protease